MQKSSGDKLRKYMFTDILVNDKLVKRRELSLNSYCVVDKQEQDLSFVAEKLKEENKKGTKRLILYVSMNMYEKKEQYFLVDIKKKTSLEIDEKRRSLAKEIVKLKKKFNFVVVKDISEKKEDEEKGRVITIEVKKKKKKKKPKPVKYIKKLDDIYKHIVCTDATANVKLEKSVVAGILYKKDGAPLVTYRKNINYNPDTEFLEAVAIVNLMKLVEIEGFAHVLFKTDSMRVYDQVESVKLEPHRKRIISTIQMYLIKYPFWNLKLSSREEVEEAHKLARSNDVQDLSEEKQKTS